MNGDPGGRITCNQKHRFSFRLRIEIIDCTKDKNNVHVGDSMAEKMRYSVAYPRPKWCLMLGT